MVRTLAVDESLLPLQCSLGEAALWDVKRQRLYSVDIIEKRIYTYEPSSGTVGYAQFSRMITALALLADDSGLLITTDEGPAYVPFDPSLPFPPTGGPATYYPLRVSFDHPPGFGRFNEACVDPTGRRLICGTMMQEDKWPGPPGAALFALEVDDARGTASAVRLLDGLTCTNGMGWSADGATMWFTDSWPKDLSTYAYDVETGAMSAKKSFGHATDESLGFPDGMCQDTQGGVWTARWKGGKVVRFAPDGEIDLIIAFPKAFNMTSCIFGGPGMDELYVTSASAATSGDSVEAYPQSGDLFVIRGLGYRGQERTRFKGNLPALVGL